MSQHDRKKCYGTMFPSVLPLEADKIVAGKVFSFEIVRAGGAWVSHRRVATNMQEWDDCLECPNSRIATSSVWGGQLWRARLRADGHVCMSA